MDKRELEKSWMANNALIAFIGALLMGQQWQLSEGTYKLFWVFEVPDYSGWVVLGIIAILFSLSIFLALGAFFEWIRRWAFRWRSYYASILGILVWIAFILTWLSLLPELPPGQWWFLAFLLGGFLFSFVFIPLQFFPHTVGTSQRKRGPAQDNRNIIQRIRIWLSERVRLRRIREFGQSMGSRILQRLGAVYLIGVSLSVGVYFIVNPLHAASYNPENIWLVLDILMAVAAALALGFNLSRKLREGILTDGESPTHRYWEVNIAFYATIGVTILLLHSWFSVLALGLELGDHQGFVKWAVVDTLLPLVFGATGFAMWRRSGQG